MELVTLGSKYQIVIPKSVRKKYKNLKPGALVGVSPNGEKISIDPEPQSWVERTRGMMTEAWRGIDMIAEVKKIRDEEEDRLKEQEQIWSYGQKNK